LDLITEWEWKQFAVIYEESERVVHFQDFFPPAQDKDWDMKLFQLQPDMPYRDILWQVKEANVLNVILDVQNAHILEVLKQVIVG